jgi:NADPH2:quinone reductase
MAIQMATAAGLKVMGTASTPQGLQAIMDAGAIAAFDHSSEGYMNEVKTREPNGFDICIEMLANRNLGEEVDVDVFLFNLIFTVFFLQVSIYH